MKLKQLWPCMLTTCLLAMSFPAPAQAQSVEDNPFAGNMATPAPTPDKTKPEPMNFGKLTPGLYKLLQSKGPDDKVKVIFWLNSEAEKAGDTIAAKYPGAGLIGQRPSKDTDIKQYEKIAKELYEAKKQAYRAIEEPISALIKDKGFDVSYRAESAPIVFAEIPKMLILELENKPEIDNIYENIPDKGHPLLDNAAATIGSPILHNKVIPLNGTGVTVAMLDNNGINYLHPNLTINCRRSGSLTASDPVLMSAFVA